jgi:hypothetical protein
MDPVVWLVIWGIIWSIIGALIGLPKNRMLSGVVWCLLLGPLGAIIALLLPSLPDPATPAADAAPTPPIQTDLPARYDEALAVLQATKLPPAPTRHGDGLQPRVHHVEIDVPADAGSVSVTFRFKGPPTA